MAVLCKICLMYGNPLKEMGASITLRDALETDDDLLEHIEMVHCIVVNRDGETAEQATARVKAKNPDFGTERCRCPDCVRKRRR